MKHKMRDAMLATLSDACDALPGAGRHLRGSRTRTATAARTLIAASICIAYRKGDDAVAEARKAVEHPEFPLAIERIEEIYRLAGSSKAGQILSLAGHKVEASYRVSLPGTYTNYVPSHAEDIVIDEWLHRVPCQSRIDDIVRIFVEEMAARMPDIDRSDIRHRMTDKAEHAIAYPGWDDRCVFGDCVMGIQVRPFAHGKLSEVRQSIRRTIDAVVKRRDQAAVLHARSNEMRAAIDAAIAKHAPDLPFNLVDLEMRDNHGNVRVHLMYEGTGFNFRPAPIESIMKKDLEHYVAHVLPGIVNAQRQLRSRMDGGDPDNVLIEEPFARLLMARHGDGWVDKVDGILSKRSGDGDKEAGWTAKFMQGVLRGDFQLADRVQWRQGTLCVPNDLPDTVLMQLQGKLLAEIVQHPHFGDGTRITAAERMYGYQQDANGNYAKDRNGKYVKGFTHLAIKTDVPSLRIGDYRRPMAMAA